MVFGSHANTRAIYSTPPCPSLAASTAAYRRRSFSDSHPKNRCIFCSTSAAYPSMPYPLLQNLLRRILRLQQSGKLFLTISLGLPRHLPRFLQQLLAGKNRLVLHEPLPPDNALLIHQEERPPCRRIRWMLD